jgi:hypothetical protein
MSVDMIGGTFHDPPNLPYFVLHQDFIEAVRAAWEDLRHRGSSYHVGWQVLAGAIFWTTDDDPRPCRARLGERQRLQRLADRIGYRGPIVAKADV